MNLKLLYFPETAISFRLRAIKNWLSIALIACGLIRFLPILFNQQFISVSLSAEMPSLHPLAFKICLGVFIFLPVLILFSRKPTLFIVLQFMMGVFLLVFHTPLFSTWLYQYLILFFVLMFYNWRVDEPKKYTPVFNTLKLCMVLFCVWGGAEKLLSNFNGTTWPWMLSSFNDVFTPAQISFFKKAGYVLPIAQLLAGFSLLLPTVKRIGIPVLFLINLILFLLTGPMGHSVATDNWPWYFINMILIYILFAGKTESKPYQWSFTLQFKPAYVSILLVMLAPALFFSRNKANVLTEKTEQAVGLPLTSLVEASSGGSSETTVQMGVLLKQNRK